MSGNIDNEITVEIKEGVLNNISFSFNHEYLEMFLKVVTTKKFSLKIPIDSSMMLSTGNKFKYDKETEWSFFMTLYTTGE